MPLGPCEKKQYQSDIPCIIQQGIRFVKKRQGTVLCLLFFQKKKTGADIQCLLPAGFVITVLLSGNIKGTSVSCLRTSVSCQRIRFFMRQTGKAPACLSYDCSDYSVFSDYSGYYGFSGFFNYWQSSLAICARAALLSSLSADLMVTEVSRNLMFLQPSSMECMVFLATGAHVPFSMKPTVRFW